MPRRLFIFLVAICLLSFAVTLASAEGAAWGEDGPWIAIPDGVVVPSGALTEAELIALSDLDGDPETTTVEELRMREVLRQVLGTMPTSR